MRQLSQLIIGILLLFLTACPIQKPSDIQIAISPVVSNLTTGESQIFTANFINSIYIYNVKWSVTPSTGLALTSYDYSVSVKANIAGLYILRATSTIDSSAIAEVSINVTGASVTISTNPNSPSLNVGASQIFTATVANSSNSTVTWNVSPSTGVNAVLNGNTLSVTANMIGIYNIKAISVGDPSKFEQITLRVPGLLTLTSITTNNSHSCGIGINGAAYCWGKNNSSQLGDNHPTYDSVNPVAVAAPNSGNILSFTELAAGKDFTCGLTPTGKAYCWGENIAGQLGNIKAINTSYIPIEVSAPSGGSFLNFSSISAGSSHACGLTSVGKAYCWGTNSYGQIGNSTTILKSNTPVAIANAKDGTDLNLSSISAGNNFTCGLTTTGKAYCWGNNEYGQLGIGSITPPGPPNDQTSFPIAVIGTQAFSTISTGYNHTCALSTTGQAYCWGSNFQNELGNNNTTLSSTPVAVLAPQGGSTLSFSSVYTGVEYSCGLTTTSDVYCWGSNYLGNVGNNSAVNAPIPVPLASPKNEPNLKYLSISRGGGFSAHTCGITTIGKAYCWGGNFSGELGNYTVGSNGLASAFSPIPVAVTEIP
jgi:alpha-tubulin suppressor-like RCC1 family protein